MAFKKMDKRLPFLKHPFNEVEGLVPYNLTQSTMAHMQGGNKKQGVKNCCGKQPLSPHTKKKNQYASNMEHMLGEIPCLEAPLQVCMGEKPQSGRTHSGCIQMS